MSYNSRCAYRGCDKKNPHISNFRFPVKDEARLRIWIQNSGNVSLNSLSLEKLRNKYICAAHFKPSSINQTGLISRLIGPAVPIPFGSAHSEEGTSTQMIHKITKTWNNKQVTDFSIYLHNHRETHYSMCSVINTNARRKLNYYTKSI